MFENLLKTIWLKSDKALDQSKEVIKSMEMAGFSFVWNSFGALWEVRVDLSTMYKIVRTNKMAGAYIEKISNMVGRYWFYLEDGEGNMIDPTKDKTAKEIIKQCSSFFKAWYWDNKSFDLFASLYFTQVFASGEVVVTANKLNDFALAPKDWHVKVLDTRWIKKKLNDFGEILWYEYKVKNSTEKFSPMEIMNFIAYPDVDNPTKGLSKFNRIYMEALANYEASSRQMYFFRNNAMPNVIVALDNLSGNPTDVKKKVDDFKNTWQEKFGGASNQGKPLITSVVKEIKVLDTSNVDMDLINLRKENDKDFAVIFLMDTRLIGINKETGSFSEIESTTIRQGNDQIDAYGELMSESLNILYRKFIDPNLQYVIKLKNAEFTNDKEEREIAMKEIHSWVRTQNSYIQEFNSWTPQDDNEEMNSFVVIDRLKGKSKPVTQSD